MRNFIFLLNAFEPNLIHRIELVKEKETRKNHFKILGTVITTTNDLFILSKTVDSEGSDTYEVCKYDLDKSNQLERKRLDSEIFIK